MIEQVFDPVLKKFVVRQVGIFVSPPEVPAAPTDPPGPAPAPVVRPEAHDPRRFDDCWVVFRCTPAYKEWVVGLADHLSCSVTTALVQALLHQSDLSGYSRPPKRYHRRYTARYHPCEDEV